MVEAPEIVTQYLTEEEVENLENRNGWAVGVIELEEDGEVIETINPAFIELYNGEGRAMNFGGVGFMADDDGEYREAKAYATYEAFENANTDAGWYVKEYIEPENPNYGKAAP